MPQENPPAHRRWLRPRIWMMMVALPAIALAFVYWAGIDPFRLHPYSRALHQAEKWCASGVGDYWPKGHFDSSGPEPVYIADEPDPVQLPCLIKIWFSPRLYGFDACNESSTMLSLDGRRWGSRYKHNWAWQGGQGTVMPAEMMACEKAIAALPPSQDGIPFGNAVVIGFLDKGVWSTRVYDKAKLPPEVASLGRLMELNIR